MIIILLIKLRQWKNYFAIITINFEARKGNNYVMKRKREKGKNSNKENFNKKKKCYGTRKVLLTMKHNVTHEQVCAGFKSNYSVTFLKC